MRPAALSVLSARTAGAAVESPLSIGAMPQRPRWCQWGIQLLLIVGWRAGAGAAAVEPLGISLHVEESTIQASPYGPGTSRSAEGQEIAIDSQSFTRNKRPWIPVVGEFHFARYPRGEWREELLRMKAGGIEVVSSYVFWIHHEEEQGHFDWSGQRSLRDFLSICRELGLLAVLRIGPWCHGEVRNGGYPDWVQNAPTTKRLSDPRFQVEVERWYREQARQLSGLLWKDGGPVIGVQLDNECTDGAYLLGLKALAIAAGIDVPFYAITGWQGGVPSAGLMPLFGGYADGFWGGSHEDYRREFMFSPIRATNDLGAQLQCTDLAHAQLFSQYPYACVEIGPGMMSSYRKRVRIDPDDVAALALAKLGSGNNMPGYYMYHGGTNPDGRLSTLEEAHPNQLPVKDYDFQTALGACGQVRRQYHLLRQQHGFLRDFGSRLARMPAFFPDQRPASLADRDTLRWSVRSDGRGAFLFFSNRQPQVPLPEHRDVQFSLAFPSGTLVIPSHPIAIPSGSYGIFPVALDCDGISLRYATAMMLGRIRDGRDAWYVLGALEGIPVELALGVEATRITVASGTVTTCADGVLVRQVTPGLGCVLNVRTSDGGTVHMLILSTPEAAMLYRMTVAGQERLLLSDAAIIADGNQLRLQSQEASRLSLLMFPPLASAAAAATTIKPMEGIFTRMTGDPVSQPQPVNAVVQLERPAQEAASHRLGLDEGDWNAAAIHRIDLPAGAGAPRRVVLSLHYIGTAARLYDGERLVADHFFNGDAFAFALWRIPASHWPDLRIRILPLTDGELARLPPTARQAVILAREENADGLVTMTAEEMLTSRIACDAP